MAVGEMWREYDGNGSFISFFFDLFRKKKRNGNDMISDDLLYLFFWPTEREREIHGQ